MKVCVYEAAVFQIWAKSICLVIIKGEDQNMYLIWLNQRKEQKHMRQTFFCADNDWRNYCFVWLLLLVGHHPVIWLGPVEGEGWRRKSDADKEHQRQELKEGRMVRWRWGGDGGGREGGRLGQKEMRKYRSGAGVCGVNMTRRQQVWVNDVVFGPYQTVAC